MAIRHWFDWIIIGAAIVGTCLMGAAVGLLPRPSETAVQPMGESAIHITGVSALPVCLS